MMAPMHMTDADRASWNVVLESYVDREVIVLLDMERCPLMGGMSGILLGKVPGTGALWRIKVKPGQTPDGQMTPSGVLVFATSDLVRLFDPAADGGPSLSIVQ
jgi:hypothetical protein